MRTKIIKHTLWIFVAICAGIFIAGTIDGVKTALRGDKSIAVKEVLSKHCDCDEINQFLYSKGIQFNTEDGITTEKAEYELVNCSYQDLQSEIVRLNNILLAEVDGYADLDILKLEFIGQEQHHTITIKNGIIQ